METILVARKKWSNAAAFIELNPKNGEVRVYGKFYDNGRGYGGPSTEILGIMPKSLIKEAKKLAEGRVFWNPREAMQPELAAFCDEIWTKAKEVEPWFKY
ncbi:MAG: hypothetical protein J6W96_04955 [Alphaproteobacteria bacterium]|nr:hypothetical protein [Alphaproteobacteria bacterium]